MRVALIHWNAEEGRERAARLRRAGHQVALYSEFGPEALRRLRENPPATAVIDLSRVPSHGRAVGVALRRQKSTRLVPLIFAGGDPDKVAATRELLPDANYAEWSRIRGALRRAVAAPPAEPVAPDIMAGYAGTPLPKKLAIKPGSQVALLGAPADFEQLLGGLPEGVRLGRNLQPGADLILLFVRSRGDLEREFQVAERALRPRGGLWIAWPKQTSGVETDLTAASVRAHGLARAFVDYKICAINQTWSGLLFVRRTRR